MKTITYDDTLYQLVPKEATPEMVEAHFREVRFYQANCGTGAVPPSRLYRAMLAAAPTPPAQTAERKPLTLEQIEECFQSAAGADEDTHIRFARIIEAEHGIKGES